MVRLYDRVEIVQGHVLCKGGIVGRLLQDLCDEDKRLLHLNQTSPFCGC